MFLLARFLLVPLLRSSTLPIRSDTSPSDALLNALPKRSVGCQRPLLFYLVLQTQLTKRPFRKLVALVTNFPCVCAHRTHTVH